MWWWTWASRCPCCSCPLSDVARPSRTDHELHALPTPSTPSVAHAAAPRPGLYTARHPLTQELVALQVLDRHVLRDRPTRRRLRQEVRVLRLANGHEHLLQLHDVRVAHTRVELTFELARGGHVLPKVRSERDASRVVQHAAEGLLFLHGRGIVHGQVRPEYLLYSEDAPDARVLLVAFGRAAPWKKTYRSTTDKWLWDDVHHVHFVPPFLLRRRQTIARDGLERRRRWTRRRRRRVVTSWREAQQIDTWALGVTLYVMLCGCYPFSDGKDRSDSVADIERRVLQDELTIREHGAVLSRAAKDLLRRLLEKDPEAAMSIKDVAAHPWLEEAVAPGATWSAEKLAQHQLFTARYAEELLAIAQRSSGSTASTSNVMMDTTRSDVEHAATAEAGGLTVKDKARRCPGVGGSTFDYDTLEMDTNEEEEEEEEDEARPSFISTHGTQLLMNEEVRHERPSADSFMRLASLEMGANNMDADLGDEDAVADQAISSSPDAESASVSSADISTTGGSSRRNSIDKMLLALLGQRRFFSFKSQSSGSSNDRS